AQASSFGIDATKYQFIGIIEIISLILFIVPRTGILGTMLLVAYMGGAIVTHLQHQQPIAMAVIFQILLWVTAFIRFPELKQRIFFNYKSTFIMIRRDISKITQNHWHNGFLGTGHRAMAVLEGVPYKDSDPFILFMDDSLNLPGGEPVGGAHPHAGFETLSLVLEGNEKDWKTGSFELMTAGKGIIHTEEITSEQKLRMLQVWLVLPPEK